MSKSRRRTSAKKAEAGFVPLLLVGPPDALRDDLEGRLASALDVGPRSMAPDDLPGFSSTVERCGVAVFVSSGEFSPDVIEALRDADPALPIIAAVEGDRAEPAISAFQAGAQDVLIAANPAPETLARMREWIVTRATLGAGSLFGDGPGLPRMLGGSSEMREVARLVERVASADATVLILGESGTGKELVARAVHVLSSRRKGPFVAINCAAIPDTLLENELFGHEKGAYTGANATAIGKVEAANKGTLFLDEIGEMPVTLQSKILRLLQEKTYDRIGGTALRKADIRIVTATNRDLRTEAQAGRFREDLYYRLSVVPVTLPALRDRPDDIALIARDILRRLAASLSRPGLSLTDDAMERLVSYRWPGNVRELENELERAAVMCRGESIGAVDLELRARVEDAERAALARWIPLDGTLRETVEAAAARVERLRVSIALEESGGDKEAAATALGLTAEELEEKIASAAAGEA